MIKSQNWPEGFLKEIFNPRSWGIKCRKMVFLSVRPCYVFRPLLQKSSKDLPNFLHECRGQYCLLFEQDRFSEKILNPGL